MGFQIDSRRIGVGQGVGPHVVVLVPPACVRAPPAMFGCFRVSEQALGYTQQCHHEHHPASHRPTGKVDVRTSSSFFLPLVSSVLSLEPLNLSRPLSCSGSSGCGFLLKGLCIADALVWLSVSFPPAVGGVQAPGHLEQPHAWRHPRRALQHCVPRVSLCVQPPQRRRTIDS